MTKFKEWENVGTVDLLVGGTPCQSFSVAGLRKGLTDPRGNLMLTFGAIANHFKARWVVWENVPGVLSSNKGRDFGFLSSGCWQNAGMGSPTEFLTLSSSEFPSGAGACSLSDVLEVGLMPQKYYLTAVCLSGNPPPSRKKGERELPEMLKGKRSQGLSAGGITPTLDKSKVPAICLMDQGGSCMQERSQQTHGNPVISYGIPGNWIGRKPENGGNATTPMVDLSPCITGMDRPAVCIPLDMRGQSPKGVGIGDEAAYRHG